MTYLVNRQLEREATSDTRRISLEASFPTYFRLGRCPIITVFVTEIWVLMMLAFGIVRKYN